MASTLSQKSLSRDGQTQKDKMRKILTIGAVLTALLVAVPVQGANLVGNHSFETPGAGDPDIFAIWVEDGAVQASSDENEGLPGTSARLRLATGGSVEQSLSLSEEVVYCLDFFAKKNKEGDAAEDGPLEVSLPDGTVVEYTLTLDYVQYFASWTGDGDPLKFFWADNDVNGLIDTVTVDICAVPEPTTMLAGALLLLPFGVSTLRILRKKRVA